MSAKPLIPIQKFGTASARASAAGGSPIKVPGYARQATRLTPQFSALENLVASKAIQIQSDPTGTVQEQVLVFQTMGSVTDFAAAVAAIPGMEWLAEFDQEDIPPDDDFHKLKKDKSRKDDLLTGRLYLVLGNQTAMGELLRIWREFSSNPDARAKKEVSKWKAVFKYLKEIRPWGPQDRFELTGALEDWNYQLQQRNENIKFQIEPWFKRTNQDRTTVSQTIRGILQASGGRVLSEYILEDVAYHGILAEVPAQSAQSIIDSDHAQLVHCDYIMFARPLGQGLVTLANEDESHENVIHPVSELQNEPIVALLDGLPIQNHPALENRLLIDDPEEFESDYPATNRVHGTSMASTIIYGGHANGVTPIKSKILARPIMQPGQPDLQGRRWERPPSDILEIDRVHRAVREIIEGVGGAAGYGSVKVINYSVGDAVRQFDHALSPMARLIDWLAWKYNLLFVVSAGNHARDIELNINRQAFEAMTDQQRETAVLSALIDEARNQRIVAPADSINALTVGAANHDWSTPERVPYKFSLLIDSMLPSTYSAFGLGYRRSIKPDIIVPGGRLFYTVKTGSDAQVVLEPDVRSTAPGISVASPRRGNNNFCFDRGTSQAAAITSHFAEKFIQNIKGLTFGDQPLNGDYQGILAKALIVHTSSWNGTKTRIEPPLASKIKKDRQREFISRLVGYGVPNFERGLSCTDQRATLIAADNIANDQAHQYEIPLPVDLSGKKIWKRITVTLCWLSPTNAFHKSYRKAALWVSNIDGEDFAKTLKLDRTEADYKASLRGTTEHLILEGEKAISFQDGATIKIQINCREDAPQLVERIKYGIAVTVEVKEGIQLQIYNQIHSKVRPRQAVQPNRAT